MNALRRSKLRTKRTAAARRARVQREIAQAFAVVKRLQYLYQHWTFSNQLGDALARRQFEAIAESFRMYSDVAVDRPSNPINITITVDAGPAAAELERVRASLNSLKL